MAISFLAMYFDYSTSIVATNTLIGFYSGGYFFVKALFNNNLAQLSIGYLLLLQLLI